MVDYNIAVNLLRSAPRKVRGNDIPVKFIEAVPGAGKTTHIINNFTPQDLIAVPSRRSRQDIISRLH
ncbi:hypothetical protein, partial [Klebsiella pneumoniae]|uniref:hypothetical protein n=1 Tax=Klebsiella pneumoniae TaxID=573 RepID=UPI00259FF3BD